MFFLQCYVFCIRGEDVNNPASYCGMLTAMGPESRTNLSYGTLESILMIDCAWDILTG